MWFNACVCVFMLVLLQASHPLAWFFALYTCVPWIRYLCSFSASLWQFCLVNYIYIYSLYVSCWLHAHLFVTQIHGCKLDLSSYLTQHIMYTSHSTHTHIYYTYIYIYHIYVTYVYIYVYMNMCVYVYISVSVSVNDMHIHSPQQILHLVSHFKRR